MQGGLNSFLNGENPMNLSLLLYIDEVSETQGKLFSYAADHFPQSDTEDFINAYIKRLYKQRHPQIC